MKYLIVFAFLLGATMAYGEDSNEPSINLLKRFAQLGESPDTADSKATFGLFDFNEDGKIASTEILLVFQLLGKPLRKRKVQIMVRNADADRNGTIDFSEFLTMKKLNQKQMVREAFEAFDLDNNGFITAAEFQKVMTTIGVSVTPADADALIKKEDKDDDNQVNYEEFAQP